MPTNEAATLPAARRRPPRRLLSAASSALILMLGIGLVACGSGAQHQGSATGPGASTSSAAARGTYQLPTGTSSHVISVDGTERTFLTYRPAGLPSGAPLVVMLHGDGGSGSRAERDYHWDAGADRGHFIVAYPNGLHSSWNTGGGCCFSRADDIGFVSAMISAIENENPIDRYRVYAAGMSSGGMLAYALACQTTIFAAIAPVSATQLSPCPDPAPVSVIHIHGTADQTISYYPRPGGAIRRFGGPDIPQVNAAWRRIDHCAAPVIATSRVVTTSIASCPDGRTVELITIADGGHQWPEAVPVPGSRPSTALNASQVIWKFFASHHS